MLYKARKVILHTMVEKINCNLFCANPECFAHGLECITYDINSLTFNESELLNDPIYILKVYYCIQVFNEFSLLPLRKNPVHCTHVAHILNIWGAARINYERVASCTSNEAWWVQRSFISLSLIALTSSLLRHRFLYLWKRPLRGQWPSRYYTRGFFGEFWEKFYVFLNYKKKENRMTDIFNVISETVKDGDMW